MKRTAITSTIIIALALAGWQAHAETEVLYRWTDENGDQFNSDRPPPVGIEYEVISTSSSMVRKVDPQEGAVPASVKSTPGNEFEPKDPNRRVIEKNPELCARAEDNLVQLDTRARIRLRDEQGEVRYLNEEERAAEREKAIAAIEAYCD